MKSGIYKITNIITSKIYIGSTKDFAKRWKKHRQKLNTGAHTGVYLQRAWTKYGEAAFVFEIVEEVEPERLLEREQFYLDQLFEAGNHYNVLPAAGSSRGVVRSPETRARMSEVAKVRTASLEALRRSRGKNKGTKFSDETRAKMSATQKERYADPDKRNKAFVENQGNRQGRKHSEESKAKMSKTRRGAKRKPLSEETKAKIAASLKGKPLTEERKANISAAKRRKKEE